MDWAAFRNGSNTVIAASTAESLNICTRWPPRTGTTERTACGSTTCPRSWWGAECRGGLPLAGRDVLDTRPVDLGAVGAVVHAHDQDAGRERA